MSVGVYSLAGTPRDELRSGVRQHSFAASLTGVPVLSRLDFSCDLRVALDAAAAEGALLHVHGLWRMPNVYPGRSARRHDAPLVLSPRGMLGAAALAFSARQKRLYWHLAQAGAVAPVRCFHATSEAEVADIRAFGMTAPAAGDPQRGRPTRPPAAGPTPTRGAVPGADPPQEGDRSPIAGLGPGRSGKARLAAAHRRTFGGRSHRGTRGAGTAPVAGRQRPLRGAALRRRQAGGPTAARRFSSCPP